MTYEIYKRLIQAMDESKKVIDRYVKLIKERHGPFDYEALVAEKVSEELEKLKQIIEE